VLRSISDTSFGDGGALPVLSLSDLDGPPLRAAVGDPSVRARGRRLFFGRTASLGLIHLGGRADAGEERVDDGEERAERIAERAFSLRARSVPTLGLTRSASSWLPVARSGPLAEVGRLRDFGRIAGGETTWSSSVCTALIFERRR